MVESQHSHLAPRQAQILPKNVQYCLAGTVLVYTRIIWCIHAGLERINRAPKSYTDMDYTNDFLSDSWAQMFLRHKPLIPAVVQLVTAIVIIIVGCFGEIHVGTPWWTGILYILSGVSLCLLYIWKLHMLEIISIVTVILSIMASVASIVIYALEFSNPQLFPHSKSDVALTYQVDVSILGLCSFQFEITVWILTILFLSRRATNH
ncbi:uncharacterized protein LOC130273491 [Hyla sarda]|uniref:uncharacterized protein LOC130273491 n=1 Tax=Hyla sarda TaxID=327740 RepID=UPI0024C2B4C3|nr:uncharacterized protein LOC130273491 [Hyla sarda]